MTTLARRYARAAVEAAAEQEEGAVEVLLQGLETFQSALQETSELRELVTSPVFKEERNAVLERVLGSLGIRGITANTVRLLAANDRMAAFDDVVQAVSEAASAQAGLLQATVRSAVALTDDQTARVAKALEKRLGKPVTVTVEVDRDLLGGFVCKVGDLTFDTSLKRQLEILRESLEA